MVKLIVAIVSVGILSVVAGMYFMQAGDDEVSDLVFNPNPMVQLTGMDRVKISLVNQIAVSHQDDGEIRCENRHGVVTLAAHLEGNDGSRNGYWMTSRGMYLGDGSLDPAEKLFNSLMWDTLPNLATVTSCTGLGYSK